MNESETLDRLTVFNETVRAFHTTVETLLPEVDTTTAFFVIDPLADSAEYQFSSGDLNVEARLSTSGGYVVVGIPAEGTAVSVEWSANSEVALVNRARTNRNWMGADPRGNVVLDAAAARTYLQALSFVTALAETADHIFYGNGSEG